MRIRLRSRGQVTWGWDLDPGGWGWEQAGSRLGAETAAGGGVGNGSGQHPVVSPPRGAPAPGMERAPGRWCKRGIGKGPGAPGPFYGCPVLRA